MMKMMISQKNLPQKKMSKRDEKSRFETIEKDGPKGAGQGGAKKAGNDVIGKKHPNLKNLARPAKTVSAFKPEAMNSCSTWHLDCSNPQIQV